MSTPKRHLKIVPIKKAYVNSIMVRTLQDIVKDAKNGDIDHIVIVAVGRKGRITQSAGLTRKGYLMAMLAESVCLTERLKDRIRVVNDGYI